jgi:putative nucleotidyltransferase with HDIG domain
MTRRRILFVDDEVSVLDGLQNILRKQRHVWDMAFARGSAAALAELELAAYDVIVSDMKMPGMDGPALLQVIKDRYPAAARIVLSGQAERDAVLRALPVAHQFLSKPCDIDLLRAVIDRTCNLQMLLQDDAIRRVVGKLDTLPSVASSYWALTRALQQQEIGLADVAAIVEQDPGMTAKVLQLVNSAYFGLAHRITSIQQAVMYLGIELLKGLLLTARVFALMDISRMPGFSLDRLQQHSLLTARVAKRLVTNPADQDEAFTAALLHDVGHVIFALGVPERFAEVLRIAHAEGRPLDEVEREVLCVSHSEVGAYLLGVWGLPFPILEAIANHHQPHRVAEGSRDVLAAVHVADALVDGWIETGDPNERLDVAFLESAGWDSHLPAWRQIAAEEIEASRARAGQGDREPAVAGPG